MVKWLVSAGCDIYDRNREGETALLCAVDSGKLSVVTWLVEGAPCFIYFLLFSQSALEMHANAEDREKSGNNAVLLAAIVGSVEILEFLVSKYVLVPAVSITHTRLEGVHSRLAISMVARRSCWQRGMATCRL